MEFTIGDQVRLISVPDGDGCYYFPPIGSTGEVVSVLYDSLIEIRWPKNSTLLGRQGEGDTWYARLDQIKQVRPDGERSLDIFCAKN